MIKVGIIGYGYWGPNLARNFNDVNGCRITAVSDLKTSVLKHAKQHYPWINITNDYRDIIKSTDIDAVVIATPVSTHYQLAKEALENSKHVFIEKPMTTSSKEANALIMLAQKKKCLIMVDHTFLFTGSLQYIKDSIRNDSLGKLYYYDSTRVSLGAFQKDVDVIWDLAPHDFYILDYLIKNKPRAITAHGMDHFQSGRTNVAYITVYFEEDIIAHINVNWLAPVKVRTIMLSGYNKMLLWNDLEADEKIKVYDRGVNVKNTKGIHKLLVDYRTGNTWSPRIDRTEALAKEAKYFIHCIKSDLIPFNDGYSGLRVIEMLEAASKSLKNNGRLIKL